MKEIIKKFIPKFILNYYHWLLPIFGAFLYNFPSKKIKVIGIIGTDGKTTTTNLIVSILEQAGYKVASISTTRFKIGNKEWKNTLKMTMPGRFNLQSFLKKAVDSKCEYAVLEVTDEGIKQYRHCLIDFKIVILTNITPEHIEAHGSFEKMRAENEKLFQITKETHIINIDDENKEYFLKYSASKKYGYSLKISESEIKNFSFPVLIAQNIQITDNDISFSLKDVNFNLNLLGEFNIYNALAAICFGLSEGISLEDCQKFLKNTSIVPGRMEVIIKKPFQVIVDYAHTVVALEKVYQTIKNWKLKNENSRMICVFGSCGGGRDRWKRSEFGKIASKYCNEIILTNEDPYNENPFSILEDIEKGFLQIPNSKFQIPNSYFKIIDRREAINKALNLAKLNDIVIITGKGREPWICVADGKKIPWDDGEIVKEEFNKLNL